jgi:hypothetical protein
MIVGAGGDLALAIALVSRWACAAMACAKCAVGENLFRLPCGGEFPFSKSSMKCVLVTHDDMGKLSCQKII